MANYFKITDVKIFPCAYRGQNINPEASSFTEYNFTNIYSKQGEKKESFIVSYTETDLKCVIGGYYFEITNFDKYKKSDYKYLAIKIANKELVPFEGTTPAVLDDTTNNIFLGVAGGNSLAELSGCSASLQIFDSYEETMGDSKVTTYKLCESSKRLEDIIDAGKGKYSIGSYYTDNDQSLLNTASGKHSIAFGEKVAAKNDYAIVLGDKLESSAANQVILGTGTIENLNKVTTADQEAAIQVFKAGKSIYKLDNNGNEIISGNIKTNGIEETDKVVVKKPAEITKTLKVTEKITASGGLEVTGKTVLKDQLSVDKAVEIKDALTITKSDATITINELGIKTNKSITAIDKITSEGDLDVERNATVTGQVTAANAVLNGTNIDYLVAGNNKLDKNGNLTIAGDIISKSLKVETTGGTTKITLGGNASVSGDFTITGKLTSALIKETEDPKNTNNKIIELTAGTINAKNSVLTVKNLKLNNNIEISVADKEYNDLVQSTQTNGLTVNNTNAICFNTGIDTLGPITVYRNDSNDSTKKYAFAAFEPNKQSITSGISFGGTAYFKQRLIVGGNNTNLDIKTDTAASGLIDSLSTGCILYAGTFGAAIKDKLAVGGDAYFGGAVEINSKKAMTFGTNIKINENGYGRIVARCFGTSSDFRLKQNIKSYKAEKSILDLDIKEFEYINDTAHKKHIGAIAQDVQEICPEIVYEDANGYLSIEENKLVYLLLNEVKELKKEIKRLKGE